MTIEETNVSSDAVAMTDLGEQLRSSEGAARLDDIGARFDRLIERIAVTLSTGVSVDDHSRLLKIRHAAQTARKLLGTHS